MSIVSKGSVLLLSLFISFKLLAVEYTQTEEVISQGLGKDIPSAAQNAAQNALIQVVGSFMDSTKLLEKQVVIQDGVREQTSKIDTNVKEYSQGSIQSFEVLEVGESMGLTQVTAQVVVRIEDFKAYIQSLAQGDVEIQGDSLFAQAATQTKQTQNKVALLVENVLEPIVSSRVIDYQVRKPVPLQQWMENNPVGETDWSGQSSRRSMESWAAGFGIENVFALDVTATLNRDFMSNMEAVLEKISEGSRLRARAFDYGYVSKLFQSNIMSDDVPIVVHDGEALVSDIRNTPIQSKGYIVSSVKQKLMLKSEKAASLFSYDAFNVGGLEVLMLDGSDEILQNEIVTQFHSSSQGFKNTERAYAVATDYTSALASGGYGGETVSTVPWLMLSPPGKQGYSPLLILEKRRFVIFVVIDQEALAKTSTIRVKLVED